MNIEEKLYALIRKYCGEATQLHKDLELFKDLGIAGDDFHEFMEEYAQAFNVDMSGYLWYFHADEEGVGFLGGIFCPPPYKRVGHIPVTPAVLKRCAESGVWDIEYPEHVLPRQRYDVVINKIIVLGLLIVLIVLLRI